MLFGKLVLGFTGVVFSLYGIACFVDPAIPADFMGVDLLDVGCRQAGVVLVDPRLLAGVAQAGIARELFRTRSANLEGPRRLGKPSDEWCV